MFVRRSEYRQVLRQLRLAEARAGRPLDMLMRHAEHRQLLRKLRLQAAVAHPMAATPHGSRPFFICCHPQERQNKRLATSTVASLLYTNWEERFTRYASHDRRPNWPLAVRLPRSVRTPHMKKRRSLERRFRDYIRLMKRPSRVSICSTSPTSTNMGTFTSAPVSSVAGLVEP